MPLRGRRSLRTTSLYFLALLRELRWSLGALGGAVLLGACLFAVTPHAAYGGKAPPPLSSAYFAWMMLFGEVVLGPPETWYLALLSAMYPLLGIVLVGEGIVRLALLLFSRRHGEPAWMKVMASTYRDHVILCGLGHLGYRVLEHLVEGRVPVVAIEKDPGARFLAQAKATGTPVIVHDMKDDQALVDAGVAHAAAIIVATNDDIANLEVALDARRMNPGIRVVLRLFDQQIARKIAGAMAIDAAFSSSALAAPIVAAMAFGTQVLASFSVNGSPHLVGQLAVDAGSPLAGLTISEVESKIGGTVLARSQSDGPTESPPQRGSAVRGGDTLVVHIPAARLPSLQTTSPA
ncbi:MAG: NAD-binding protein [Planctomycetes bacterium]|nr:NAD-binding protein [Planctomycetota bacterium]